MKSMYITFISAATLLAGLAQAEVKETKPNFEFWSGDYIYHLRGAP